MTPQEWKAFTSRLTESEAAALTAYGEARNQPVSGLQAVLSVMRNRVKAGKWGGTWNHVVFAPFQFSCWNEGDPNRNELIKIGQSILDATPRPVNPVFDVCRMLAERMVDDSYPSNVMDSTHYYAPSQVDKPKWAYAPAIRRTVLGSHVFYANVK